MDRLLILLLFVPFFVSAQVKLPETKKSVEIFKTLPLQPRTVKTYNYTVQKGTTTASIGIYKITTNTDGTKDSSTLVRTIKNNWKVQGAGIKTGEWDGRNDNGIIAEQGDYYAKVLTNSAYANYENVIGNTSINKFGFTVHHGYQSMFDMIAVSKDIMYYTNNYGEGSASIYKFTTTNPQIVLNRAQSGGNYQNTTFLTTDGINVYYAGTGGWEQYNQTFIYATEITTGKEIDFQYDTIFTITAGRQYNSIIDFVKTGTTNTEANIIKGEITGLAVQRNGKYLLVTRKGLDRIDVVNKITGKVENVITNIVSPEGIACDLANGVWIVSGINTVIRYTLNGDLTLTPTDLSLSGLINPCSISISPDGSNVTLTDGGSSQQVKSYSSTTGRQTWVLGQPGGYYTSTLVTNDRFFLESVEYKGQMLNRGWKAFVAYQADGSFWVGDGGTARAVHFSSNRKYLEQIMYLPRTLAVSVHRNDSTKIYGGMWEFKVDYSKPLAPDNGSWKMSKNFMPYVWKHGYNNFINTLGPVTLSNGRDYSFIGSSKGSFMELVEVPTSGDTLRKTGKTFSFNGLQSYSIERDGSILTGFGHEIGQRLYWTKRAFKSFDANNNPIWDNAITIADLGIVTKEVPTPDAGVYVTPMGKLIAFNPANPSSAGKGMGYRLGAIDLKNSSKKFVWQTCFVTRRAYRGPFPSDGTFDIGNNVNYPAGTLVGIGSNLFWNYNGEFWKQTQTNIYEWFDESGLMVTQFGLVGPVKQVADSGFAGNVKIFGVVEANSKYYLYHGDEGFVRSGISRWRLDNKNSIQIQNVALGESTATVTSVIDLLQDVTKNGYVPNNSNWIRSDSDSFANRANFKYFATNIYSYERQDSPDIFLTFQKSNDSSFLTRLLPEKNSNNYTISAIVNYEGNTMNNTGGQYFQLKDRNDKIIAQFEIRYKDFITAQVICNSVVIVELPVVQIVPYMSRSRNLVITVNGNGIRCIYGSYSSSNIPLFNPTSDWRHPKKITWKFKNDNNNQKRQSDWQKLSYFDN